MILSHNQKNKDMKEGDLILVSAEATGLGMEKPRDFDPFGQTGLSPLATI